MTCERPAMVSLREVGKVYAPAGRPEVTAVRDASLTVERGEFVVVTGRSGSGKTTLLNLAAGLTRPTSGEARLDGVDLWSLPDRQRSSLRNRKVGFIFQFQSLLPSLTALENVALPTLFGPAEGREGARERAADLLRTVGLEDESCSLPRQLSAGQQQRVVVARSLMNRPELLVADEPTSDLDERTEAEIMGLLELVHRDTGVTILMVTHATRLMTRGTRALRMAGGALEG
jgi:ABC-type lipoprotein export system ATPase subunit